MAKRRPPDAEPAHPLAQQLARQLPHPVAGILDRRAKLSDARAKILRAGRAAETRPKPHLVALTADELGLLRAIDRAGTAEINNGLAQALCERLVSRKLLRSDVVHLRSAPAGAERTILAYTITAAGRAALCDQQTKGGGHA